METRHWIWIVSLVVAVSGLLSAQTEETDQTQEQPPSIFDRFDNLLADHDISYHGFYEFRAGYRTQNDPYQKDMSIMEARYQFDFSGYLDWADWKIKGDVYGDMVTERAEFDMRETNLTIPLDDVDIKIGRQILTWGTGDLLFLNDLFPKDWQAFFIGRDTEYLKAPSDAAKMSFFNDMVDVDFVYTPQFDPDRHITGERLSYWNATEMRLAGRDKPVHRDRPDRWFRDDEFALRLYKNINNVEYALYGYWGYWKSPAGQNNAGKATFPALNVYGASVRSAVGSGIGNAEFSWYESADDKGGSNGQINNSEIRFLVGYSQEIGKDFTMGLQYYIEHLMDYSDYQVSHPGGPKRDQNRHLTTLRLTKLLMNQNLRLSLFTYYSPSDQDAYIRPNINYKASDQLALELGANVFFGEDQHTFFGQFENNTNIYTAVRYNF